MHVGDKPMISAAASCLLPSSTFLGHTGEDPLATPRLDEARDRTHSSLYLDRSMGQAMAMDETGFLQSRTSFWERRSFDLHSPSLNRRDLHNELHEYQAVPIQRVYVQSKTKLQAIRVYANIANRTASKIHHITSTGLLCMLSLSVSGLVKASFTTAWVFDMALGGSCCLFMRVRMKEFVSIKRTFGKSSVEPGWGSLLIDTMESATTDVKPVS
ncbi:hypothetical protein R3P38DRAFT_3041226 [Favolaschia claudopus]|uniref:Uncharacterized protein n=1 Tax=Favolaschia claudopus TaxID=2862362 RepID=A0AAW0AB46_9AGAR